MTTSTATRTTSKMVGSSPIYYGWIVLIVATIGVIATAPGQSFTVSLFIDSFIEDFGLSRTMVSALFSGGTFIGSLSLTFVGRMVDRHGNRTMTVIVAALFATTLVMFSLVNGPIMLFFGFLGIRMLGQGSLALVNTTVIVEWFKRLRGRVMSIVFISFSAFQWAYVPWLQRQLEVTDWRTMWIYLGVSVALVVIPLAWLFMRNTPEEFGLLPDGDAVAKEEVDNIDDDSWTLNEVLKNTTFRVFVLGRVISPAWGTGLILHQVSIFTELGHDAATAAATFATMTIAVAVFSILFGILVDRLRPGIIMALQLIALIAAMLLATLMTSQVLLWIYALCFGFMMGGGAAFDGTVWVNMFGRKYQGSIRGFVTTANVIGTAIGPILFGLSLDLTGTYTPVLWLGTGLAIIALISALIMPMPKRKKKKNSEI